MPSRDSRSELAATGALLFMGAAWGSTFFLIKNLLLRIGVADLLAVRFVIGAAVLAAVGLPSVLRARRLSWTTVWRGAILGGMYGVAQVLQTAGLGLTSASTSGFVTGLYVVMTPLFAALVFRVRLSPLTWLAAILATAGLAVLALHGVHVGAGELLTLASSAIYAAQIVALSRWSRRGEAMGSVIIQTIAIAVVCTLFALPGGIALPHGWHDWLAVLYLALIAGVLTLFLQTWAQARVDPARAAVLMSSEPVWAAVFAVTLGTESVTWRMLVGGGAIVTAMYLVELAPRLRRPRRRDQLPPAENVCG